MRLNGLCVENGRLCEGVKNPLTYYRRMLRRRRGGETDTGKAESGEKRG